MCKVYTLHHALEITYLNMRKLFGSFFKDLQGNTMPVLLYLQYEKLYLQ